ncbi:hypothetical protein [Shimia sp. FJ5]|uniref:hypothetical protein n=1 Tax=Shimia sp. FJ5 TaxID=3079054 RepID=UPI00262A9B4C|nr:hypothetical protein [Shimia sp. FJ5]MDV4146013.1 hypothetical protein [Shimia sp. FJ5]
MSDPVTNVEIEDVLSSIRRLISENDRTPKQGAAAQVVTPEPKVMAERESAAEPAPERLVLTPALRVAENPVSETDPIPEEGEDASLDMGVEPLAVEAEHTGEGDAEESVAETVESFSEPGYDPMEGVTLERAREIDSRIVHWDKMGDATPAEDPTYEPDEPGDSDYAGTDVEPLEWQDEDADEAVEAAPSRVVRTQTYEDAEAEETVEDVSLDADAAPEEDLAGLASRVEAELRDSLPGQIEAELQPEDAFGDLAGEDAMMLDDAVLRDMVADIVRQELQGALGERITRNVRKLVRREIHRALAAHELD